MSGENQKNGDLVGVKRVRRDTDMKGREKLVLTFGLNGKTGANDADTLISVLEGYRGKQVNFDIRIEKKKSERGTEFDTAFVKITEMIPRGAGGDSATYAPKRTKQDDVRERAKKFQNGIE